MKNSFKRLTRILVLALCLSFLPLPASLPVSSVKEVSAAIPVVKIRKRKLANGEFDYYGFVNGKKISGRWGKLINKGVTYWFYFGKNAKAYKAYETAFTSIYKERFVVKKINGRTYGFDQCGRRITGTWYSPTARRIYYFAKNGVYSAARTKTIQDATKKGKQVTKASLQRLFGKCYKREVKAGGCFEIGSDLDDGSRLVYYTFKHVQVVTSTNTSKAPEKIHLIDAIYRQ